MKISDQIRAAAKGQLDHKTKLKHTNALTKGLKAAVKSQTQALAKEAGVSLAEAKRVLLNSYLQSRGIDLGQM